MVGLTVGSEELRGGEGFAMGVSRGRQWCLSALDRVRTVRLPHSISAKPEGRVRWKVGVEAADSALMRSDDAEGARCEKSPCAASKKKSPQKFELHGCLH